MDKVVGVVEMRNHLPAILKKVAEGQRFIITQRSKAKAVLLSPEEIETMEILADKNLLKEIHKAKEDIKKGRVISYEKYFKEKLHA